MRRKVIICLITLLVSAGLKTYSQTFSVKAGFKDLPLKMIYLAKVSGDKYKIIDSAKTDISGTLKIYFKKNAATGQYRFLTENKKFKSQDGLKPILDFLFNKENIEFTTYANAAVDSMKIISSEENKLFFEYLRTNDLFKKKMELLNEMLVKYPKSDDFYKEIKNHSNKLAEQHSNYYDMLLKDYKETFFVRFAKTDKPINIPKTLTNVQRDEYIKEHFFDNIDFDDTLLINSNCLTNKLIAYLTLYREQQNNKDKQEIAFIKAVDKIIKVSAKNKSVYEFVLDYLISGFEKFDFNKVLNYIADNSRFEEFCTNDDKTTLETKLESYKKFVIGKKVPDIIINDINNKQYKLSEINSDYILIIFWASWCPHCEEMMPELKKYYQSQKEKKLEIFAVSLDWEKESWKRALDKLNNQWINTSDLNGWEGKSVKDYCIYATPTLYLVDKNLVLKSKPRSLEEIMENVN